MGKRIRLSREERFNILQRDSFCCTKCGRGGRTSDWILEVHHIDCDPSNNAWSNLTTLCVECHNNIHKWRWTKPEHQALRFSQLRRGKKKEGVFQQALFEYD